MSELSVQVVKRSGRKFYQLEWHDPTTGKKVSRSAGTTNARDANRLGAKVEAELRQGLYRPDRVSWKDFREQYLSQNFIGEGQDGSHRMAVTTFNAIDTAIAPQALSVWTESTVSRFRSALLAKANKRGKKLSAATVNKHLRNLRAMLNWAVDAGLLARAPKVKMVSHVAESKGRAIGGEEFERMLAAIPKVIADVADHHLWSLLLHGLWASGLRLSEALNLQWYSGPVHYDDATDKPVVRFQAGSQKNRKTQEVPVAPEFVDLLDTIPVGERSGYVFNVGGTATIEGKTRVIGSRRVDVVGRVISEIGRVACVRVNSDGKCASAHDLRRSFCTRWAARVMPSVLMRMVRHSTIQTTMAFYVGAETQTVADAIWATVRRENARTVDTSADSCGDACQTESSEHRHNSLSTNAF